ncbi:MerR family transcriptional regulator [Amycolatopsis sp. PS_44_ISF1]|uniref:MerR family transcriptional regulator n=1 Tax=Amycolatopsis sp. PS_44_ISF1 TaxID=2974917 RepID=UPI0028DFE61E|nr:MerR family transcriptional regulator [Amycolatopsis sp. PS_44_ISF1]MDT8913230.1 MerR family transcriptional regulator [Amycolatopsis sp. PS_44_ISF1]
MAWSTREVADLAGASVRAVRHYHEIGLLSEPERGANGYKHYGPSHLLRVLRIKRLTTLGFSLPQIAAMGEADDHFEAALRSLDEELAATVARLRRTRVELKQILSEDVPAAPEPAPTGLTDADRAYLVVLGRVLGPVGLRAHERVLRRLREHPAMAEFDRLPAGAGEDTRRRLAERLAPHVGALHAGWAELKGTTADAPRGPQFAEDMMNAAIHDLYNPAQIDVMARVGGLPGAPGGPGLS